MPSLTFVPRVEIGRSAWDAFAERSDEAWLWHSYDYQAMLATWPGREDLSCALLDDESLVAVLPAHAIRGRRGPLSLTRIDSQGGPALAPGLEPPARERVISSVNQMLRSLARRRAAALVTLTFAPLAPARLRRHAPDPIVEWGLARAAAVTTRVVDLGEGIGSVRRRMHRTVSYDVARARRSGVRVRDGTEEDLDTYLALHRATYMRTGARPHPREYFEGLWRIAFDSDNSFILIAESAGDPIAAATIGVTKRAAVYWTGASDERALRVGANHLLQLEALERLCASGVLLYELGEVAGTRADAKQESISQFKSKFGGDSVPLHRGHASPLRGRAGRLLAAVAGRV